jgi:Leucine-rich repeat (LRR) protein
MRKANIYAYILLLALSVNAVFATDIPESVVKMADAYFATSQADGRLRVRAVPNLIEKVYQTADTVRNQVYVFQQQGKGFVVISGDETDSRIVGYAKNHQLEPDAFPDAFRALLNILEQQDRSGFKAVTELTAAEPVVAPMLNAAGIQLNQFYHDEVGSCPSGCVATALVQIMAYHKFPQRGIGSHCYVDKKYGEQCADFENTTYNWNQPTDNDYRLLSKHVGTAMEMQYCFDKSGSVPGINNYIRRFSERFGYHVIQMGNPENEYVYMELNAGRPVYLELWGDPGHALVIDGYDSNGFLHLNFGWGGRSNGYFQMNTNTMLEGHNYGTNMASVAFLSTQAFTMNESDSNQMLSINNKLIKWDAQQPIYSWPGVKVAAGRVVELDLTNTNHVSGQVPEEIGQLDQLFSLKITGNLTGTIPAAIFNLQKLRRLVISNYATPLNTTIPVALGNLVHLEELELTRCVSGRLPDEMANLQNLRSLKLWANELSGSTLPDGITELNKLRFLELPSNQIGGSIPENIGQLQELIHLNLSQNQLEGNIPESIGALKKLTELKLSENQFQGNLPVLTGELIALRELNLAHNRLSGNLTSVFDSLTSLQTLSLNDNQLTSIPASIGKLEDLRILLLDNNLISSLPDAIGQCKNIHTLGLTNNLLTDLPASFVRLANLRQVNLSKNQLTRIPMALTNFSRLNRLDLSHNLLTTIPEALQVITPSELYLNNNLMSGPIPEALLKRKYLGFDLRQNRFVFDDIPRSDSILNPVGEQQSLPLLLDSVGLMPGDTLRLHARKIIQKTSPGDIYHWYAINADNQPARLLITDSVLTIAGTPEMFNEKLYCVVTNEDMPTYLYEGYARFNSLNALHTDTFQLKEWSEQEYLNDKYQANVLKSELLGNAEISNLYVTLVSPWEVRGQQVWQGSLDQQNWYDLSADMTGADVLKGNLVSVQEKELVIFPRTNAWYRNALIESNCHPRYSDTINVVTLGTIVCDTIINVRDEDHTITLDSIDITLPMGLSDGEIQLSVIQTDVETVMPDSVIAYSPIYEVSIGKAITLEKPLIIRFKNLYKASFDAANIENFRPAYYDEIKQEWVFYEESSIDFKDTTLTFMTDHLTKLRWFEIAHPGYTHRFTNELVNVYYNSEAGYMNTINILYDPKAKNDPYPWYEHNTDPDNDGTPYMVQDIAHYTKQIIEAFKGKGLSTPRLRFNVYLKSLGSAAGMTDAGTFLAGRGYIYIDPTMATVMKDEIKGKREYLKSVLAHEYMHFTQDYYMTVLLTNYFWMEATAPLADRIVWPEKADLEVPEPEQLLSEALTGTTEENSIFDILEKPWYNNWNIPVASKLVGRGYTTDMNLASLFLHYMRSYRPGKKLDPVELLKQTPYTQTWTGYLNDFIKTNLADGDAATDLGTEYDRYVRFLYEGSKSGFNVFNHDESPDADPLQYLKDNYKSFVNKYIRFPEKETRLEDELNFSFSNLSSKMVQIYNFNNFQKMLVKYYRKSKPENVAVYTGRYNGDTKMIEWTDVSKQDTITFVAGIYDPFEPAANDHMSYILFVNKSTGDLFETSINDEMEFLLLPDLQFFDGLMFTTKGMTTAIPIHVIEESGDLFSLFGIIGEGMADFAPSIYRVHDEAFNAPISLSQQLTDSTLIAIAHSAILDQRMEYNFITGTLDVIHSMRRHSDGIDFETDFEGRFVDVVPRSNMQNRWNANRYSFGTNNTTETRNSIKHLSYKFKSITETTDEHGVPVKNEITRTYVSTTYPTEDIVLYLMFY